MLLPEQLQQLSGFRQLLHQYPEISGQEIYTADRVRTFIEAYAPPNAVISQLGGDGLAFIYHSPDPDKVAAGKTILVRAELDGLPIPEENHGMHHCSQVEGNSHSCGHDGHMAILAATAIRMAKERPKNGRVVILFQPAEETGQGAQAVINDPRFEAIRPDYAMALHNIPGLPLGHVRIKEGPFSSSVESLIFRFDGVPSHAAYPEQAANPAFIIADAIYYAQILSVGANNSLDYVRTSLTHVMLGESDAHGVTAGKGQLNLTIRAHLPEKLQEVKNNLQEHIQNKVAEYNATRRNKAYHIRCSMEVTEPFMANMNHPDAVSIIRKAAKQTDTPIRQQRTPNDWGEDFGLFTNLDGVKGVMFGLGSGEDCKPLHHPGYDFPDTLIERGSNLFVAAIHEICRQAERGKNMSGRG